MTWRHLRISTGFTSPSRALLLHTAPCPYRPTDAPVGTPRGAGRPGRGSGAVDGPTVGDCLAGRERRVPTNAIVMRPAIGFEIPKGAGSPLI